MTRQIIDVGANANDGTGEPLRQAFQAVNDNFANIWAAGPVDTQVVISNNVISTNVTNLELILAGNGIGTVTVESTVVPSIDSVYDLGSTNKQFDSVYARYFYGNGRYLTGIPSTGGGTGGNVYFSVSPPLDPNFGDIWIDSDSGVQYLYFSDNVSNVWAEMEAYQSFSTTINGTGNGTPGGSNAQIQFNDNGSFGASANLLFNTSSNQLQLVGDLRIDGAFKAPGHANLSMQVYGNWGGGNNYEWVFDNLGRLVLPTVTNTENGTILGNSANVALENISGNIKIVTGSNVWAFSSSGTLELPAASVESTPTDPGFANQTQKLISGSIDTILGNPVPSYSESLGQSETIWTATNTDVTSAKMTLRVQYGTNPASGVEMSDIVVAKEWGSNANVSYVISNRLITNNSLSYADIAIGLDGSDNLTVSVTNTSGLTEYYSYSITEFNRTAD